MTGSLHYANANEGLSGSNMLQQTSSQWRMK
jgi:hypothetical protein